MEKNRLISNQSMPEKFILEGAAAGDSSSQREGGESGDEMRPPPLEESSLISAVAVGGLGGRGGGSSMKLKERSSLETATCLVGYSDIAYCDNRLQ